MTNHLYVTQIKFANLVLKITQTNIYYILFGLIIRGIMISISCISLGREKNTEYNYEAT